VDGRLTAWTIQRATASGLGGVAHGALVELEGAGPALVTALREDHVELAPLSAGAPRPGAAVRALGPLATLAGEEQIGRVVDCLGRPLDGGPAAARAEQAPIFDRDPAILAPGWKRLTLGALVYDLQRVMGVGTSLLASGPGEVLRHVLRHQVSAGRIVVLATPGGALATHLGPARDAWPAHLRVPLEEPVRCIHVSPPREATPAQQWLVPWTAMAIASSLRARGHHVVVAIDHLDAWQPHVRAFPSRGAWPTQLAQLASRAYARPGGSVSLIAMTRVASAARAAAFDGVLDLSVAVRGELPVIGTKLVRPPIRVPSVRLLGGACVSAAYFAELASIGPAYPAAHIGRHLRFELEQAERLRECLRFRVGGTVDSLEQELCLLAVMTLLDVPAPAIAGFIDAYLARLRRDHAATLAALRAAGAMSADDERELLAVAASVAASFVGA
jgi:hypothetical protein